MEELMRTNDQVMISLIESLLQEEGIVHFVADTHMSTLEGSLGFMPRRVLVEKERLWAARRLVEEAGLAGELPAHESDF